MVSGDHLPLTGDSKWNVTPLVTNKQNHINTAIQIRKQKLQPNRQTIGAIDSVPQLILSFF